MSLPIDLNWWAVPPLVSFLTLATLAGLSFATGKRRTLNVLFSGICLLGTLLSVEKALLAVLTDPAAALQVSRLDHMVVVYFVPLYLHFTVVFLHLRAKKGLIISAYIFSALLSLFSQSDYYLVGVTQYAFGFYPRAGVFVYVFAGVSCANTFYCLYLLAASLQHKQDPARRNKTKYIILGLGGAALMAHANFLPLMGIHCYPLGNFAFIPLLALGFAVMKHDLLDIGMAVQKGLMVSVLTGLVTAGYGLAIIVSNHVFKNMESRWSVAFPWFFFVLIVFVFEPLKRRVQGGVDTLLFKGKYDYQKTLTVLSDAMTSMLNLDEIMEKTLRALTETMHLEWAYVLLKGDGHGPFTRKYRLGPIPAAQPILAQTSPMVAELEARKREATRFSLLQWTKDEDRRLLLETDFNGLGGTVIVPMICKGRVNGLLVLGDKQSGDLFTGQDLELLRTLANQCAVSIENAKAYQVIENLNANLERMVEQRTRQLTTALEQKEEAQELLIRSESLASVGALVAGVAHELNNPLTSAYSLVQSSTDTIQESRLRRQSAPEDVDLEEVLDDLRFSLKELNRAKEIVASLLGLSRQTQNYSEPVRINHVAKDALKILSNQYKKTGIAVTEVFQEDLPRVMGNFANLGQVFLNILTNAIQAVNTSDGRILVRTWSDDKAGKVVFECTDNGPGIAPEVMTDIFKPFFTTKSVGKGTGLGLYISHEIVQRHGGYILFKNNDGRGATFQVALPVDMKL